MQLPILYQDDYLVAIDKPAGLLVHRSWLDKGETRFAMQMTRRITSYNGCYTKLLRVWARVRWPSRLSAEASALWLLLMAGSSACISRRRKCRLK